MKYYVVTGRIAFDVEDIIRIIEAEDAIDANAEMYKILNALAEAERQDENELTGVIVTGIVECGTEKPRLVFSAGEGEFPS